MSARRKGISIIYMMVYMVVITAFVSLGVDYGRVQMAKTDLRRATDAAARAGAAGIVVDRTEAIRLAQLYASRNRVDGVPLSLRPADFKFVKWNLKDGTYTTPADFKDVNAIWISASRSPARGEGIPLFFTSLLGIKSFKISAESVALVIPAIEVDQHTEGTANPFLAGMPAGSLASTNNPARDPDVAGTASDMKQSPTTVKMPIVEGSVLTFDSITGLVRHDPNLADYNPDGQFDDIGHNNPTPDFNNNYVKKFYNENGIADVRAPINAMVGVFLSDTAPNKTPAPTKNLDFSTPLSRDFAKLEPELKQIFFIGDGADSNGNRQEFVVPKGATRLYLATWDFYQWSNNPGFRDVEVKRPMKIITVK